MIAAARVCLCWTWAPFQCDPIDLAQMAGSSPAITGCLLLGPRAEAISIGQRLGQFVAGLTWIASSLCSPR